ncbi:MAG: IS6 family transposase [Candidatus Aenigmarchaeota archaeon]|nr:IS6 family transposase [Candidatus Aenigmarchaeota archaeon]
MRFPREVVEAAIGLYTDGLSLRKVRKRIKKIFGLVIKSSQTILNWLKKFGKKPRQALKGLAKLLHADETMLKTYKKGLFFWFWAIRCKGMQPVGWHVSLNRNLYETKMLMWETRRRFPVGYWPETVRTDKMPAYGSAIHKVFGHDVRHEQMKSFKHGNNVIENFFRCKNRFPRFRTLEGATIFINHWLWENSGEDSIFSCLLSYLY